MAPVSSTRIMWLTAVAVVVVGCALLGPTLPTPFRSEDYVDIDLYSRHTPLSVFTTAHLRTTLVAFYRPLSDLLDALMVRAFGARPVPYHALLLLLMIANALFLCQLARRLGQDSGALAGAAAALLYISHPLQQGTLSYFEGGMAHVSMLCFTLLALLLYLRYRRAGGLGAGGGFLAALLAAMLCFDGALVLPVVLLLLELLALLPRTEVHVARRLLRLAPALVALAALLVLRRVVVGTAFAGYGLAITRPFLLGFPAGFAVLLERLLTPAFVCLRGQLPPHVPGAVLAIAVAAALALSLWRGRGELRLAVMAALFAVTVLVPATPDFVASAIANGDIGPESSYRLSVPIAFVSLATGFALAGAARSLGRARTGVALAATLLLVLQHAAFAPVFRAHNDRAGVIAETIKTELLRVAPEPPTPVFLVDTPVGYGPAGCVMMRVFLWGLANALRPPASPREVLVYPLLVDPPQLIFKPGAVDAVTRFAGAAAWRFDARADRVVRYTPQPDVTPALPLVSPSSDAVVRLVDGCFAIRLATTEVHELCVVMVNRVAPFYLANVPGLALPITHEGDTVVVRPGGAYVAQILAHFPDDPVFVYVEDRSDKSKDARVLRRSQVIRVWLRQ